MQKGHEKKANKTRFFSKIRRIEDHAFLEDFVIWVDMDLLSGLIMWIGHYKEIRISLRRPIHIINLVDKTKSSCNTVS